MTGRERLVAASRGGEVDRQPLLWMGKDPSVKADGVAVDYSILRKTVLASPDQAVLCWVDGVWCQSAGAYAGQDIDQQAQTLDEAKTMAQLNAEKAMAEGADGICYRIGGVSPAYNSPMEYGGLILERDREVLESVSGGRLNVVYVENDGEAYLDFLTDLPCHYLAWTGEAPSGLDEVRSIRGAAVAHDSAQADAFCAETVPALEIYLQQEATAR